MAVNGRAVFLISGLMMIALAGCAHPSPEMESTPRDSRADAGRWLGVEDGAFVDDEGSRVVLRGIQLDFGSLRGDIGVPVAEGSREDAFCDRMLEHVVGGETFQDLRQMGANAVRLSLNTYLDYEPEPFQYDENNLRRLDAAVNLASRYGLYVILSMRQSPGGHNPSPHSGNDGRNAFWSDDVDQERMAALWQKIAGRYSDVPHVAGYDLLNEPMAPDPATLNRVYERIAGAIRSVDQRHILFLEGNAWAKEIDEIRTDFDAHAALSIHFYEPGQYAVQGSGSYPGYFGGVYVDKGILRETIEARIASARQRNLPVLVGEFGAVTGARNYLEYGKDLILLLEEEQLSWVYWNYFNYSGRSDSQALYYLPPGNPFLDVAGQWRTAGNIEAFTDAELEQALNGLSLSHAVRKQPLWDLLDAAMP